MTENGEKTWVRVRYDDEITPEENARDAELWRLKQAEDLIREVALWEAKQSVLAEIADNRRKT